MNLRDARVSVINSVCVPYDAISNSVMADCQALESVCPGNVVLFSYRCDLENVRSVIVSRLSEMLLHPHFLASNVLLFHFGIYYELFDALILGNGSARRFAQFHNVTPIEFASDKNRAVIERSFAQIENLGWADHVWCDSEYNKRILIEYGLEQRRLSTSGLPVDVPSAGPSIGRANDGPVKLLYVGRLVPAKGSRDLVRAAAAMRSAGVDGFRIFLAGNLDFSDAAYVATIGDDIREARLEDYVTLCGQVSDAEKASLMAAADALIMPSYHEGFCVPIVEALGRGCYVIGYDAGNVPFVTNGLGSLVATGDVHELTAAMSRFVRELQSAVRESREPLVEVGSRDRLPLGEFRRRAHAHARTFRAEQYRARFLSSLQEQIAH